MDASLAKVTIEIGLVIVFVIQLLKVAQIVAQLVGRNRCIFPTFPLELFAGHKGAGAQPGLTDLPDQPGLLRIIEELHGGRVVFFLQFFHQCAGMVNGFLFCFAAELNKEPATAARQQLYILGMQVFLPHALDEAIIKAL